MWKEVPGVLAPMSDVKNLLKRLCLAAIRFLSLEAKIPFSFPSLKGVFAWGGVHFKLSKLDVIKYST